MYKNDIALPCGVKNGDTKKPQATKPAVSFVLKKNLDEAIKRFNCWRSTVGTVDAWYTTALARP